MSRCSVCHHDGLYFAHHADPDGYVVLACTCPRGERWRTPQQLKAFAAHLEPAPLWYGRLEEFFTAQEIATLRPVAHEHAIRDGKEYVPVGGEGVEAAEEPPLLAVSTSRPFSLQAAKATT